MAEAALGNKVVDATNALLVAAVPVLHCGVLDFCVGARAQLHHRSVQLCANQADLNILWTQQDGLARLRSAALPSANAQAGPGPKLRWGHRADYCRHYMDRVTERE